MSTSGLAAEAWARGFDSRRTADQTASRWRPFGAMGEAPPFYCALGELAKTNALILLDENVETVRAGEAVKIWEFDED